MSEEVASVKSVDLQSDEFLHYLDSGTRRFENCNLYGVRLSGIDSDLEFRNCTFHDEFVLTDSSIPELSLDDCSFLCQVSFQNIEFGRVSLSFCVFSKQVGFIQIKVKDEISIANSRFDREFKAISETDQTAIELLNGMMVEDTEFMDVFILQGVVCHNELEFNKVKFRNDIIMQSDPVTGRVSSSSIDKLTFSSVEVDGGLQIQGTSVDSFNVLFSKFNGNVMFSRRVESQKGFLSCDISELVVLESVFSRDISCYGGTIRNTCYFENVAVGGDLMFSRFDNRSDHRSFIPTKIGFMHFEQCHIEGRAELAGCVFTSDCEFINCIFDREVYFYENEGVSVQSCFGGDLTIKDCVFSSVFSAEHIVVEESVSITRCAFNKSVWFSRFLDNDSIIKHSTFNGPFNIESSHFSGLVHLMGTVFESDVSIIFSVFESNVRFSGTKKGDDVEFIGSVFKGVADFSETRFEQDLSMYQCEFIGPALFNNTIVGKDLLFSRFNPKARIQTTNTVFHSDSDFSDLHVNGFTNMEGCIFEGIVYFSRAIFERETVYSTVYKIDKDGSETYAVHNAEFNQDVIFDHADFHGDVCFSGVLFKANAKFESVCFGKIARFSSYVESDGNVQSFIAEFNNVDFSRSHFLDYCEMSGCTFRNSVIFDYVNFLDTVSFANKHQQSSFSKASFKDVSFSKGALIKGEMKNDCCFNSCFIDGVLKIEAESNIKLDFTDSEIIGVLNISAKGCRVVLDNSNIAGTVDLEPSFDSLSLQNAAVSGQVYVDWEYISENSAQRLDNLNADTYRILKENYARIGRYDDEDRAYIDFRKTDVKEKSGRFNPKSSLYLFFSRIGGLGTRMTSIVLFMFAVIIGFALLYAFLPGVSLTESGGSAGSFWDNLYFSIVTFLTVGFDEYCPMNSLTRILTVAEAFSGIFLMFYFTMAFARKILR